MVKIDESKAPNETKRAELDPWIEGIHKLPVKIGWLYFHFNDALKSTEDGISCEYFLKKNDCIRCAYTEYYSFLRKAAEETLQSDSNSIDFRYFVKEHPLNRFKHAPCCLPAIEKRVFNEGKQFGWDEETAFVDNDSMRDKARLQVNSQFCVSIYDNAHSELSIYPAMSVHSSSDYGEMDMLVRLVSFLAKNSINCTACNPDKNKTSVSLVSLLRA